MDLQITRWIREQDENGAVSLARTLCMAEAGHHALPLGSVSFSGRVKASDQGIDGRTQFPEAIRGSFPLGAQVWQVKSGSSAPSATTEFNPERHTGLIDAIKAGADYVLFWTNDPTEVVRSSVRSGFTEEVRNIRPDAKVTVLFADEIERLCYQHLSVLAQNGPVPISGLVGLEVWAPLEFELVEFQADDSRRVTLDLLRQHVAGLGEPNDMHVFGDTGVGKSRLVYEALSEEGIRERVLVAPDPSAWDRGLLSIIASTPEAALVLVVDDCDADERRTLTRLVGMARGRIRLITIGSRANRERPVDDRRRREVLPLEIGASQKIALSMGLNEHQATLVANLTEGYPGLAATLAKAIAYGGPQATLLERIRGDDDIGPVLASLVDEAAVPLLGLLALFERIGFEGDLAPELTLACEVFRIDEVQLRAVADRELQRFVSTAGRFRRVTPRLFAIWLASRFLEMRAGDIVQELNQLPESLRERILDQMREFAGDPVVSRIIGALLVQAPFNEGAIGDVNEGAARLIHVASIVNPDAAIAAIERIMLGATTEHLISSHAGRRAVVYAIEVLLWSDEYFERAATAALRLAIAENEEWANNATGAIQGIYRVFLGGTSATYARRINWTRKALDMFGRAAIPVIVPALAFAFDAHEMRISPDLGELGGRMEPAEWRPSSFAEETAARRAAWNLLIEVALSEPSSRADVAGALSRSIRTAILRGLSTDVLTTLRTVDWPARGRAEIIEALNHARAYDNPDTSLDAKISALIGQLAGKDFSERARYVFAASVWELSEDRDEMLSGQPRALIDLVEEAAMDLTGSGRQLIELSHEGNSETVSRVFEGLAKRLPDVAFERKMEDLTPLPVPALVGYVRGLAIAGAVNPVTILERWRSTESLSGLILQVAHLLPESDELARLAISAVRQGASPADELGRFMYGGWTRSLGSDVVGELLTLLVEAIRGQLDSGDVSRARVALDQALGIADQWTADNPVPSAGTSLRSALEQLLAISGGVEVRSSRNSMLDLHVAHIVPRLGLTTRDRLSRLMRRLQSLVSFPSRYDLEELDALASAEPAEVASAIVDMLTSSADGGSHRWGFWLEDAKILTRIQSSIDPDGLAQLVVERCRPEAWRRLVAHIAFDTEEPDRLLVALLGRSRNDGLRSSAAFQFMHPHTVSSGSESDNLRRRRDTLGRWRALSGHPEMFADWLDSLTAVLDANIRHAEGREAEQ